MLGAGTSTTHTTYIIGQSAGVETVTLTPNNIPPHNHAATFADHGSSFSAASARASTAQAATGSVLGRAADGAPTPTSQPEIYCPAGTATPDMLGGLNVAGTVTVGVTGQGLPLSVLNPYNVITQAIVTSGIFPSRG
jgi:microcystin-dependent protein